MARDITRMMAFVEITARARGDPAVPREYIERVLRGIKSGEIRTTGHPVAYPGVKPVYDLALRLYEEESGKRVS